MHKVKYYLQNYHCGMCETGVVQIHQQWVRAGTVTTKISGCLDCGHEYGIKQAQDLIKYSRNDMVWA